MSVTIMSLYQDYKQDIYYYLVSLTHDKLVAEDLTSEVFVSAITALPRFHGQSDIKTWLFAIARHKWYEHLRHSKKENTALEKLGNYLQDSSPQVEETLINAETTERITTLLECEKEQHKNVVIMRIEGYSFYEIATALSISESSARVIDFRVRKRLKETLVKEGFTCE